MLLPIKNGCHHSAARCGHVIRHMMRYMTVKRPLTRIIGQKLNIPSVPGSNEYIISQKSLDGRYCVSNTCSYIELMAVEMDGVGSFHGITQTNANILTCTYLKRRSIWKTSPINSKEIKAHIVEIEIIDARRVSLHGLFVDMEFLEHEEEITMNCV